MVNRLSDKTAEGDFPAVLEGIGWFILFALSGFLFFHFNQRNRISDPEFNYIFWTSLISSVVVASLRRKLAEAKRSPLNGPLDDRLLHAEKAIDDAAEEVLERATREAFRAAGRFLKRARDLRHDEEYTARDIALFEGAHVTSNNKLIVPTSEGIEVVDLKEESERDD